MNRKAACYLTLIVLFTGCTPVTANLSTETPLAAVSLPVVATPTATVVLQATITVIPACETSQNSRLKIMPLGDSITYGDDDLHYGGYRNLLGTLLINDGYVIDFVGSQKSGEDVIFDPDNEGHSGWRISNIKNGIDSDGWLETYQPDIILLHIGSNDLRYGNGLYAPDNLSALLDDILARLPNVYVVVAQIIPTRWGSEVNHRIYNDAIPGVVASKGTQVSIVDMRNILSKNDFITLYHPNAEGYDKMAYVWESAILELGIDTECHISK